jgi:hypothetical protein
MSSHLWDATLLQGDAQFSEGARSETYLCAFNGRSEVPYLVRMAGQGGSADGLSIWPCRWFGVKVQQNRLATLPLWPSGFGSEAEGVFD